MRVIFLISTLLFVAACSSKVTSPGTQAGGKYSEDLSSLRKFEMPADTTSKSAPSKTVDGQRNPSVYVEARHSVNKTIDAVLDSIDRINLSNGVVEGYTIQLYSGIQRDEALNVKRQVTITLPDLDADVQFVQPNFRVRAGKYLSRLEAQKDYMAVKKYFPNAIVIPDRIPIR